MTEKVIANLIDSHLVLHGLHEPLQSACKKHHSTQTALISLFRVQNDILMALDNKFKHGVLLILLDLTTAFDTIDYGNLLWCKSFRVILALTEMPLQRFYSYRRDRKQTPVVIHGENSIQKDLKYGVPRVRFWDLNSLLCIYQPS